LANNWQTIGKQLANNRQTIGKQMANNWQTNGKQLAGIQAVRASRTEVDDGW
jgi:hypothetical protein